MVERLQKSKKGATFVDLDGTLLAANSMHIFMIHLPWMLLRRKAVGAHIASLWWMGLRTLHAISHRSMKWHLTKSARRHLLDSDWEWLASRMARRINHTVTDYVDAPRLSECSVYIATAAMEEYAAPLARLLGYDGVVATRFTEDKKDYLEMRGSAKLAGIQELQRDKELRLESFITDHTDDFPTASAYPGLTILLNPSKKTAAIFRRGGVTRYL